MKPTPSNAYLAAAWLLSACLPNACFAAGALKAETAAPKPQVRQAVADLAYVLGEAHALHRACAGPEDNTWRGRMGRLLQVEAPDATYRARLMERFNAGFIARNAQFPTCSDNAAAAERAVAAQGRDLSRRLAAGTPP